MISRTEPSQAGFTLLEMLVVLVVLGLAAGLVLGRGPARSARLDLRAQSQQIAQSLRSARGQAIASNRRVTFVLDGAGRFAVDGGTVRTIPAPMQASLQPAAIVFAPDGSTSGGRITLVEGPSRMIVGVDWLTGRVSVSDGS